MIEFICGWIAAAIVFNLTAELRAYRRSRRRDNNTTPNQSRSGHVCNYGAPCAACDQKPREDA